VYRRCVERGRIDHQFDAKELCYDPQRDVIALTLHNGVRIEHPRASLDELAGLPQEKLAEMRLGPQGQAIEIRSLDIDVSILGINVNAVGYSVIQSMAGQVRSLKKAAAARANGKKGGRPRKS